VEGKRFRRLIGPSLAALLVAGACATPDGAPPTPTATPATVPDVAADDAPRRALTEPALPDVSMRAIGLDDLIAMLPGIAASGTPPATYERSNAALVAGSTADRSDEARDVEHYGRRFGISAEYLRDDGSAHVWIDLLDDPDAAHGYLTDVAGDIAKGIGGTHEPEAIAASATEYPVDSIGDEALGLEVTLEDGRPETIVLFRVGRLVVFASLIGPADADRRVPVLYLAGELRRTIAAALVEGHGPTAPGAGPDSYRFSFEQRAVVDGSVHSTTAEGIVDLSSVSCRVRIEAPGTMIDRDLVLIGTTLWARPHDSGDYRVAAGGAVADRALLAHCPPWPVDLAAAGLGGVVEGEPAVHSLEGREVLGFRGDAGALAAALGVDPESLSVEVFTVWVATGTPWILDLRLDATGSGSALGGLIAPEIPADASVQVVVGQQITDVGEAGPVRPPSLSG